MGELDDALALLREPPGAVPPGVRAAALSYVRARAPALSAKQVAALVAIGCPCGAGEAAVTLSAVALQALHAVCTPATVAHFRGVPTRQLLRSSASAPPAWHAVRLQLLARLWRAARATPLATDVIGPLDLANAALGALTTLPTPSGGSPGASAGSPSVGGSSPGAGGSSPGAGGSSPGAAGGILDEAAIATTAVNAAVELLTLAVPALVALGGASVASAHGAWWALLTQHALHPRGKLVRGALFSTFRRAPQFAGTAAGGGNGGGGGGGGDEGEGGVASALDVLVDAFDVLLLSPARGGALSAATAAALAPPLGSAATTASAGSADNAAASAAAMPYSGAPTSASASSTSASASPTLPLSSPLQLPPPASALTTLCALLASTAPPVAMRAQRLLAALVRSGASVPGWLHTPAQASAMVRELAATAVPPSAVDGAAVDAQRFTALRAAAAASAAVSVVAAPALDVSEGRVAVGTAPTRRHSLRQGGAGLPGISSGGGGGGGGGGGAGAGADAGTSAGAGTGNRTISGGGEGGSLLDVLVALCVTGAHGHASPAARDAALATWEHLAAAVAQRLAATVPSAAAMSSGEAALWAGAPHSAAGVAAAGGGAPVEVSGYGSGGVGSAVGGSSSSSLGAAGDRSGCPLLGAAARFLARTAVLLVTPPPPTAGMMPPWAPAVHPRLAVRLRATLAAIAGLLPSREWAEGLAAAAEAAAAAALVGGGAGCEHPGGGAGGGAGIGAGVSGLAHREPTIQGVHARRDAAPAAAGGFDATAAETQLLDSDVEHDEGPVEGYEDVIMRGIAGAEL